MIKIVYVVSTLNKTGPTNILAGILSHLDRKVYKPYVITLSAEKDLANSWLSELEAQKVQIIPLNLPRYRIDKLKRAFRQKIAAINPDIVHAQCFRSALLCANLQGNSKKIATIHCDFPEDFRMAYGKILGKIMAWLYAKALKKMNCLICCSRILADLLAKKFPQMKFDYVNNGVDTDTFMPVADKKILRQKLGLPENRIIFIWAGAFIPRKDPLSWVQAIKRINKPSFFFLFCGDGPLKEACQKELHPLPGAVLFTGHTLHLKEYLQAADIYVSSSLSEGLPCAVLEALSCGATVLLTNIVQHRYIVTEQMGLFADSKDSEKFSIQAQQIQTSPTPEEQQSRHRYIQKYFSYQTMSRAYQDIYKKLLSKHLT